MRLFIALNLPERVRLALWHAVAPLRDASFPVKWVRPEGIHLTLKFLGEVPDRRFGELQGALGRAARGARELPLDVGGFGVFPDLQRPRVVWVGVAPEPALELLQHQVEQEFAPLGFPTEGQPFRPHLTLGRAARGARSSDFPGLEAALERLHFQEMVLVGSIELMQSTLQSGGAVYHVGYSERLS